MSIPNQWDALSKNFIKHKKISETDPQVADNILIAWPVIINLINKHFKGKKNISILDYGCGTGSFCEKLHILGYKNITGIDNSEAMIDVANKNYGTHISFMQCLAENIIIPQPVDVITSIMVFQFIDDINNTLKYLTDILKPGGLLVFASHNPARVTALLKNNSKLFSDFNSIEKPTTGNINFGDTSIPMFVRTASEYTKLTSSFGLTNNLEDYPSFTDKFINLYGTEMPDVSHFQILGYIKK